MFFVLWVVVLPWAGSGQFKGLGSKGNTRIKPITLSFDKLFLQERTK